MPKPPTVGQEIVSGAARGNGVSASDLRGAHATRLGISLEDFVGRSPSRFRLQRYAASLTDHGGLAACFWRRLLPSNPVEVRGRVRADGGADRPRLGGLVVCGSHLCPVCAPRLAKTRRQEVGQVIAWATGQGFYPVLLTLTTSHQAGDDLAELLDRQRQALRSWRQHRAYRDAAKSIAGTISAFETTYGKHGWHPHAHILFLVRARSMGRALRIVVSLRRAWRASAEAKGLRVGRAGFRAQAGEQASGYLAKWDTAAEVAGAWCKRGRQGAETPFGLLLRAYEGDSQAAVLWSEYAAVMKGRSVLRFSPGLRAAAGLADVSDVEASMPSVDDDESLVALIAPAVWEAAKSAGLDRTVLLDAARVGGGEGVRRYLDTLLGLNARPRFSGHAAASVWPLPAVLPVRASRDLPLFRRLLSLSQPLLVPRPPLQGRLWPAGRGPPPLPAIEPLVFLAASVRTRREAGAFSLLCQAALPRSLSQVGPRSRARG